MLIVEGQERPLRARDPVAGARSPDGERVRYPVEPAARRHGASVEREAASRREADAHMPEVRPRRHREGGPPS